MPEIYLVGGAVRDFLLSLQSKDLDYTYVADNTESIEAAYSEMKKYMLSEGFNIFLETPDCLTIRAKFPDSSEYKGLVGDFVLARKESGNYYPGTRKPIVIPGTLKDDLSRRDFTVNALAQCTKTGELIDLFNGKEHIKAKWLTTPLPAMETFLDDSLRVIRLLRFSIQLGFTINPYILDVIHEEVDLLVDKTKETVSADRIRQELGKAFKVDSYATFNKLQLFPSKLVETWFPEGMWLQPTFKQ